MTAFTDNRLGFYTVEAAIFLPLVILAVITIGYFIRTDAIWESTMHGALDECSYSAASCSSGSLGFIAGKRVRNRISSDVPEVSGLNVRNFATANISTVLHGAAAKYGTKASSHRGTGDSYITIAVSGYITAALPLGFGRDYKIEGRIHYRDFIGLKYDDDGMGAEGLETSEVSEPVWIFPKSGTKYHDKNCTHVKATVHSCILTESVKRIYSPCGLCGSGKLSPGAIAFCFNSKDTAYHRGCCPSIVRHTVVIDKSEAVRKGYTPCSKCGG